MPGREIEVTGVPARISYQQRDNLLRALGITALTDVHEVTFTTFSVIIDMYERDGNGHHFLRPGTDDAAMFRLTIPVTDDDQVSSFRVDLREVQ